MKNEHKIRTILQSAACVLTTARLQPHMNAYAQEGIKSVIDSLNNALELAGEDKAAPFEKDVCSLESCLAWVEELAKDTRRSCGDLSRCAMDLEVLSDEVNRAVRIVSEMLAEEEKEAGE